jgi:hypothetical protein
MCFLSVYIICIRWHRSAGAAACGVAGVNAAAAGGAVDVDGFSPCLCPSCRYRQRDEFAFRERLEVDVAEVEARGSALALALDVYTPWWYGCGTRWWVHGDVLSRNITEWRGMVGRRCSACAF